MSKQTISSGLLQVFTIRPQDTKEAQTWTSLESWGPRKTRKIKKSHACAIAQASADLFIILHLRNFLGFKIHWINSWCYYFPLRLYRLPALREHALACVLKDIVAISICKNTKRFWNDKKFHGKKCYLTPFHPLQTDFKISNSFLWLPGRINLKHQFFL